MTESTPLAPLREGILQMEPPRLVGSVCTACSTRVFPARDFCPACASDAAPQRVALSPEGHVFSFTTVRQAPAGRPVPYTLAYVDLTDGVRVMAQVDEDSAGVRIGMKVSLVLRKVVPEPGQSRLGYAFAAARGDERVQA